MEHKTYDAVVVGGGIAGVAVAAELARHGRVLVLEREASLAYHTTGRSAAISMESYGNAIIRELTCASRSFFEAPPPECGQEPMTSPRGALIIGDQVHAAKLLARFQTVRQQVPTACWLDRHAVAKMAPFLGDQWTAGIHEPSALDLDVHAIHTGFVRMLKAQGGAVRTNAEVVSGHRTGLAWTLQLADGDRLSAGLVVNAAGAWADTLAERCNATPLGLRPLLRTVVVVDAQSDVRHCPYIGTVDEQLFIKPELGLLMVSPCDETPSEPCDALPDELGVATAMHRLERATTLRPQRVLNRWAGLRVFAPDRSPVIGTDPSAEGFVWCAALGGYGIQTAPAVARLCASLATCNGVPSDLASVPAQALAPARLLGAAQGPIVEVDDLK